MVIQLTAKPRKEVGKKVQRLRQRDTLPAVIYGYKIKNQPISVNYRDFEKAYKIVGKNTFIDLLLDGQTKKVLIYDVQKHPLFHQFLSADFYQPRLDKKMKAKIPLVFFGESEAVKNFGGILVKNLYEVEIEALPTSLPHEIKVDISKLKTFEDAVKISDLILPIDVKILANENDIIALVVPPRSEAELAELEKEAIENVEAVKVVKEEKKEETEIKEEKVEVKSEPEIKK